MEMDLDADRRMTSTRMAPADDAARCPDRERFQPRSSAAETDATEAA